ncbi:sugar transferase [Methylobacterium phyllosphaerae]
MNVAAHEMNATAELAGQLDFGLNDRRAALRVSLDGLIAALLLVLLAPLLTLLALLVRLDSPGPALFRQTRTGLNGRTFRIYKFRTMRVQEDGGVIRQARRGDAL